MSGTGKTPSIDEEIAKNRSECVDGIIQLCNEEKNTQQTPQESMMNKINMFQMFATMSNNMTQEEKLINIAKIMRETANNDGSELHKHIADKFDKMVDLQLQKKK